MSIEPLEERLVLSPLISEFMADNNTTLPNSFQTYDDWIEIYNGDSVPVTLDNWHLTDTKGTLSRWSFADVLSAGQHVVLNPNQYLVVFADGRDTVVNTANGLEFHTDFSLDKDGDYLALVAPDGSTIASEYPIGNGLKGEYYQWSGTNTDPAALFATANFKFNRIDPTIDFAWNGAPPDPDMTGDHTAVRWTGKVKPVYTEAYTFTTISDEGVRLWVNDTLLIDNWRPHNETRNSASINLNAGTAYEIKLEYYQTAGASTARLLWSSPRTPEEVVPAARLFDPSVSASKFPGQTTDISFGLGQNVTTKVLVNADTPVRAYVPTGSSDANATNWNQLGFTPNANWLSGTGGVGFEANVAGWAVHTYLSTQSMGDLAGANNTINNVAGWRRSPTDGYAANTATVNFRTSTSEGHYGSTTNYPGLTPIDTEFDNIAIDMTGVLTITQAGTYTFGVTSDDGFSMQIVGATTTWVSANSSTASGTDTFSFNAGRGADDTLARYYFAAPGQYSVRVVHFQGGGPGSIEVWGGLGSYDAWTSSLKLVGDTGGLYIEAPPVTAGSGGGTGSFRSVIGTDLQATMYGHNTSAYTVMPFTLTDTSLYDSLALRMKYDDGFVAWLNGTEIARRNAPAGAPAWNAAATAERTKSSALSFEDIDVSAFRGLLRNGANVLAIQILNNAGSPSDALALAELVDIDVLGVGQHYFATPSPGAANTLEYWASVKDTKFQALPTELDADGDTAFDNRGFYDEFGTHVAATVDPLTDTLTTTAAHGWYTGMAVRFATTGTLPASTPTIAAETTYYVRVTSATQVKVFTTLADAQNGVNAINFTSAGGGVLSVLTTGFHVVLTSQTQTDVGGVTIKYTLDGSKPTETHGLVYTGPILIDQSCVLRAFAYKGGYQATDVDAQTYIFPYQIISGAGMTLAAAGAAKTATVDVNTDTLTTTAAHGWVTSQRVRFTSTGALPASTPQIVAGNTYYIRVPDTTHFTVYLTEADALADANRVDFTSIGTGTLSVTAYVLAPVGAPTMWTGSVSGESVLADYEMDPQVVGGTPAVDLVAALKSLPSMSISMSLDDLFASGGIYANPNADFQKTGSLEYFETDGDDFQINASIKIYGGVGRYAQFMKHSFRIIFNGVDGAPTKLDYDLFGDGATESFDSLILRANFNESWVWGGNGAQYLRDIWTADVLNAAGDPNIHGKYVHLYLDGIYWGLYCAVERPDDAFAAAYFGADKEVYDARNCNDSIIAGDNNAYAMMFAIANTGGTGVLTGTVNTATDTWTTNYAHGWSTGQAVFFTSTASLPASTPQIVAGTPYFIRVLSPTTFALFTTAAYAAADTNRINFTTTGSGTISIAPHRVTVDVSTDLWTTFSAHGLSTGQAISISTTGTLPSPLAANTTYYVRVTSTTQFTLHTTAADAAANTNRIDITTSGTGFHYITRQYNPNALADPVAYNLIKTRYLDLPNLIDYVLVNYYGNNWDWDHHNWYGARQRDANGEWGLFHFFSWDAEGNLNDVAGNKTGADLDNGPTRLFNQLRANPEFNQLIADRVYALMLRPGAPLSPQGAAALYEARGDQIYDALLAESARWGDIGGWAPLTRNGSWLPTYNSLLASYFPARTANFLAQLRAPTGSATNPNMSTPMYPAIDAVLFGVANGQLGGTITAGYQLTLINPNAAGTIYYTLDESDPRAVGGGIASTALIATSGTPLAAFTGSTRVKARVLSGSTWSALHEETYVWAIPPTLRITELMYHPADPPAGSPYAADDFEFIELKNTGDAAVDLTGIGFTSGLTFTFTGGTLAPGAYGVLVRNLAAFQSRYGTGVNVLGVYEGQLSDNGERLRLAGKFNQEILDFSYDTGWLADTNGEGFSLEILDPLATTDTWAKKGAWRLSTYHNGSPGMADPGLALGSIVINEIMAHTDADPRGDWVEIKNVSAGAVNVGGWYLSNSDTNLKKYRIAPNTVLQPGQVLLLTHTSHFGNPADAGYLDEIHWNQFGGDIYLTMAEPDGTLDGYREHQDFEGSFRETAFGRYVTSDGNVEFVIASTPTPNADNSAPAVGPVVISEVMYNAAATGDEFIELYNTTNAAISLWHSALSGDAWSIAGGVSFVFPEGATIAAHGYLVLVRNDITDTSLFREKYGIPANVPILAGYSGQLSNGSDSIRLYQPEDPDPENNNRVPQILTDRVEYRDLAPWPTAADGAGPSLQRMGLSQYGNDPANWYAGAMEGTPGRANGMLDVTPPRIARVDTTDGIPTNLTVVFNENVDTTTALVAANYSLNQGMSVINVIAGATADTVILVTTPLLEGPAYTLSVSGVKNAAQMTLPTAPQLSQVTFNYVEAGNGLKGEYFNWSNEADKFNPANLKLTRIDSTVDFHWGQGVIAPEVGADYVAVRWTGRIKANSSETYTFYTFTDDGVSLWVNGQQLINDTGWHGDEWRQGSIALVAGQYYNITLEWYEGGGGATCALYWSSPSATQAVIPVSNLYSSVIPTINSVATPAQTTVAIAFSEFVDRDTAQRSANYQITYGAGQTVTITEAVLQPDRKTVHLTTATPLATGTTYTVTVSSVATPAGLPIAAGSQKTFSYVATPALSGCILREFWTGISGTAVTDLTGNANYPNNPSGVSYPTLFEAPVDWGSTYGTRMRGYVTAPTTGTYYFWIAADDNAELWISTNSNPANKVLRASVPTWTGSRTYTTFSQQKSIALTLQAGQTYYLEALQKEDGGGDNLSVAWRKPGDTSDPTSPIPGQYLSPFVIAPDKTLGIAVTDSNCGESGANKGVFTITRTGNTADAVTVYYTVTGTAATSDIQEELTQSLQMAAGVASVTINVTPVDDHITEGNETVRLTLVADRTYALGTATALLTIADNDATVVGRRVFYNNSAFDGGNPAATAADDGAIATDKQALLPGGGATFVNYTSYARGLNGIMVDIAGLPNAAALSAADFAFKVGNDPNLGAWTTAPAPASINVRAAGGAGGSDRVTITWADNVIQDKWLQVTVKANANTGLLTDDIFYFGNAVGETGDSPLNTVVDAQDDQAVLAHYGAPATVVSPYDLNRDGAVNAADTTLVQAHHTGMAPLALLGRSVVLAAAPTDWTAAGLTLRLGNDGLLHLYHTDTLTDAVAAVSATSVSGIQIVGRFSAADTLTVDFSGGNPLPGGGLSFDGGLGTGANALVIAAAARGDTLTMTATQLVVNGSSAMNLANVQNFSFDLGSGTLDLGGTTQTVGSVTLVSGQIANGTLHADTYALLGGTVSAQLGPGAVTKSTTATATVTTPLSATTVDVQAGQLTTPQVIADTLTIGAGAKLQLSTSGGTSGTSVINFLSIAAPWGGFDWSAGGNGMAVAAASTPVDAVVSSVSEDPVEDNPAVAVDARLANVDLSWVSAESRNDVAAAPVRSVTPPPVARDYDHLLRMAALFDEALERYRPAWKLADLEESLADFAPARKGPLHAFAPRARRGSPAGLVAER